MASRGLNKVMIIGNLGRDPELRYTSAGKAVASFSVAVGRLGRDAQGERVEEAEWFRVVAWERLADLAGEYLKKGMRVYVEGRLQTRRYTDREGQERSVTELVAQELMMLDGRPPLTEEADAQRPMPAAVGASAGEVDDLPF